MKLNHLFAVCCAVAVPLFFSACVSLPQDESRPASESPADQKISGLKIMAGTLFDVNTGADIGAYDYKKAGAGFSIYIHADKTRSDASLTGATVFAPCEGVFEGKTPRTGAGFLITGSDENDNYYIVIHELPQNQLPAGLDSGEKNKNAYLLSVMDKAVFEEVFPGEESDPRAALRTLKPFLRTHAIIIQ